MTDRAGPPEPEARTARQSRQRVGAERRVGRDDDDGAPARRLPARQGWVE